MLQVLSPCEAATSECHHWADLPGEDTRGWLGAHGDAVFAFPPRTSPCAGDKWPSSTSRAFLAIAAGKPRPEPLERRSWMEGLELSPASLFQLTPGCSDAGAPGDGCPGLSAFCCNAGHPGSSSLYGRSPPRASLNCSSSLICLLLKKTGPAGRPGVPHGGHGSIKTQLNCPGTLLCSHSPFVPFSQQPVPHAEQPGSDFDHS